MALGTKFYYETIEQRAKIQYFDDTTLVSEWVAYNHGISGIPVISVPIVPSITLYRIEWKEALKNTRRWIEGMRNADIMFSMMQHPSIFTAEGHMNEDDWTYEFLVDDIDDIQYQLREMLYNRITDQITIQPIASSSIIYWVDYLNHLHFEDDFERITDQWYKATI